MSNISSSICLCICFFLDLLYSPEVQMQGLVHAREELYDLAAPQIFSPAFWLEKSNPQQGSFLVEKENSEHHNKGGKGDLWTRFDLGFLRLLGKSAGSTPAVLSYAFQLHLRLCSSQPQRPAGSPGDETTLWQSTCRGRTLWYSCAVTTDSPSLGVQGCLNVLHALLYKQTRYERGACLHLNDTASSDRVQGSVTSWCLFWPAEKNPWGSRAKT